VVPPNKDSSNDTITRVFFVLGKACYIRLLGSGLKYEKVQSGCNKPDFSELIFFLPDWVH